MAANGNRANLQRRHSDYERRTGKPLDLLTFAQGNDDYSGIFELPLWPMQRLILKVIHNVVLHPDRPLPYDEWETARLAHLLARRDPYAQAVVRRTPDSPEPMVLLFCMGRGSTKTTMAALIAAYVAYDLSRLPDPHRANGLEFVKPIQLLNVATTETTAAEFFTSFDSMVDRTPRLAGIADRKKSTIEFAWNGKVRLVAQRRAATGGVRGGDVKMFGYDEMAFAQKTEGSNQSDRDVWKAIMNAVRTRFGPRGIGAGFSSPATQTGLFYELCEAAKKPVEEGGLPNVVMIQLALWEIKPGLTRDDFAALYASNPDEAEMEIGAQFVAALHTFLPAGLVDACVKPELEPQRRGLPGIEYFVHVDKSRSGDRTGVIVCHKSRLPDPATGHPEETIVVDHVYYWTPEPGKPISPRTVEEYVVAICQRFHVVLVTCDQFDAASFVENLTERGINVLETPFTEGFNYLIYRNLETLVRLGRLWMYHEPALIAEMKHAEKHLRGRRWQNAEGKPQGVLFSVYAPTGGAVTTDDLIDCLAGAAYQAMQRPLRGGLMKDDARPPDVTVSWLSAPAAKGDVGILVRDGWRASPGNVAQIAGIPYRVRAVTGDRLDLFSPLLFGYDYGEPVMIVPDDDKPPEGE